MTKKQMSIMAQQKNEQEFNEKLVNAVRKYTCLYNYKLAEYSRKDVTKKAWAAVAKEVNVTVTSCKLKWKNVRSAFVRNLKSAPSGSSAKSKKPYYLNDSMQFLLPFVKPHAPDSDTQGNLPSPVAKGTEHIESENESESENLEVKIEVAVDDTEPDVTEPDVTEPKEPVVRRGGTIQKIAKKRKSNVLEPDREFVELCESCNNRSENGDANKMFLLSLLPEVNQMNPQQTRRFKRQLMNLIDDILDETYSVTAFNSNYEQSATFNNSRRLSSASSS